MTITITPPHKVVGVVVGLVLASDVSILQELVLSTSILPAGILGMARVATKCAYARGSN